MILKQEIIVDLLDSRECGKVKLWLSTFPNIELVSRDGSTIYHSAINGSHPDSIQISDRFHLVKAISKYMKRIINGRIEISLTSETGDKEAVENAIKYHYSNGLAEGSVNKLKFIKRIMYGRNRFSLLRLKVLLLKALEK